MIKERQIFMKNEVTINILFDLLSKKTVKARYLAEKYEVSVRSVYRYISALEEAGVPLYAERGREGGFSIVDTYRFPSTFMTVKEFEKTIDALTAIENGMPDKDLAGAIDKLKSAVRNEYAGFDVKAGNLIIDAGPWGDTAGYKDKLKLIQKSIEENRKMFVRYHDRNGSVTERTIEPHVIVFKQGLWYVFAYCELRKEFRFFKTGRIEKALLTDEKFIRRDLSKMDLPLDFWHNSVKAEQVEIEVEPKVVSDVEEWLGIENVEKSGDKFYARASLPFDDGLVSKLMSFGSDVRVIKPKELKEKMINTASDILKRYK